MPTKMDVTMRDGVPVLQNIGQYREAIASVESAGSGGYSAIGPKTASGDRAYGRYQVMGSNIPAWTKQALGRSLTPQQFLANAKAQDAVFNHRFGSYLAKYGNPDDAASVWFTGKPLSAGKGRRDILGTSGAGYVQKFRAALGQPGAPSDSATGLVGIPDTVARRGLSKELLGPLNRSAGTDGMPEADLPDSSVTPINFSNTRRAQSVVNDASMSPQTIRTVADKYGMSFSQAASYLKGI